MATVTGDLKDIGGADMADRNGVVYFTLNTGNIMASGGGIRPDIQKKVTPGSDGKFSINLEPTVSMLAEAWYTVRAEWLDNTGNLISYLEFQIKVPSGGGTLSELADISGTGSGANQFIWWVGLTAPPSKRYLWLHMNPNDNTDPAGTGDVRQWR
ncbi:hypothetical protein SLW73_02660 [Glutamicibacter protophormiae]|uniref:hypothetical protein n=1 Tax=Glutamicibacter protophormiae TaxID=37930 RepID=UPI002A82904D|nr:hypothetical protein [Glutamicibacter protophormiae]WPR65259.1 hypothetical protein SLW72_02660 [Glutamicibacter protophormiae]WPR68756.1 hypothetical protein SLW73_02660 [Glutamicibacter protophormiae]